MLTIFKCLRQYNSCCGSQLQLCSAKHLMPHPEFGDCSQIQNGHELDLKQSSPAEELTATMSFDPEFMDPCNTNAELLRLRIRIVWIFEKPSSPARTPEGLTMPFYPIIYFDGPKSGPIWEFGGPISSLYHESLQRERWHPA